MSSDRPANNALQQTVTGVTPLALASFSQLLRPVSRKGRAIRPAAERWRYADSRQSGASHD